MKFLYYLIEIPFVIAAIWLVANAQVAENVFKFELWPMEYEVSINAKLALCALMLFGYIWAKINSWFAYSPLRKALRMQKKANKALNKEQEKLNETVNGLQKNIEGLQEQTKLQAIEIAKQNPKPTLKQKIAMIFIRIGSVFKKKKEVKNELAD